MEGLVVAFFAGSLSNPVGFQNPAQFKVTSVAF